MRKKQVRRNIIIASLAVTTIALAIAVAVVGCSKSSNNPVTPAPGKFNLGPFALNQSIGQTFTTGEVDIGYHCIPHQSSGMVGTVRVRSSYGLSSVTVQIGTGNTLQFFPDTITVKTGGTVTWHNNSNMTIHTATQD